MTKKIKSAIQRLDERPIGIDELYIPGLLDEMRLASEEYSKKYFRDKVFRVWRKCLERNKIALSVKIVEKYRKELTHNERSDLAIAQMYSLFCANVLKNENRDTIPGEKS